MGIPQGLSLIFPLIFPTGRPTLRASQEGEVKAHGNASGRHA